MWFWIAVVLLFIVYVNVALYIGHCFMLMYAPTGSRGYMFLGTLVAATWPIWLPLPVALGIICLPFRMLRGE